MSAEPQTSSSTPDPWDHARSRLGKKFPGVREGVLFCLYKLQANPDTSLRDFREEAKLRGIPLSGRSHHSAKVLLGLAEKSPRRTPVPRPVPRSEDSIEDQLSSVLQRIQAEATRDGERMRRAIREAIRTLSAALDGDS